MKEKIHSCKVRIILSVAMGLLFSLGVFAQQITVKGHVKRCQRYTNYWCECCY